MILHACGTCPFALECLPKVGDFVDYKFLSFSLVRNRNGKQRHIDCRYIFKLHISLHFARIFHLSFEYSPIFQAAAYSSYSSQVNQNLDLETQNMD